MALTDELYFEITVTGKKADLRRFAAFLTSGQMDDDFELTGDYLTYDDEYDIKSDGEESSFVLSNDDIGIEIDRFRPDGWVGLFCRAGKDLDIDGHFYDINDTEVRFVSPAGDEGYSNGESKDGFNDELDREAYEEEKAERDERENDEY